MAYYTIIIQNQELMKQVRTSIARRPSFKKSLNGRFFWLDGLRRGL